MMSVPRICAAVSASVLLALPLTACGGSDENKEQSNTSESDSELDGLPEAPADLLVAPYDDEISGDQHSPGDDGKVALPGRTVSIDSITTIKKLPSSYEDYSSDDDDSFSEDEGDSDEDGTDDGGESSSDEDYVRPADGQQFLAIELEHAVDEDYEAAYDEPPDVEVLIEDNGSRMRAYKDINDSQPFLVSAGEDAKLVLAVDGQDFTVSLPSGEHESDEITDVLQRDDIKQDLADTVKFDTAVEKVDGDKNKFTYSADVETVELTPYLPAELADGDGTWAPDGKAYLLVSVTSDTADADGGTHFTVSKTVQSWTANVEDEDFDAIEKLRFEGGFGDDTQTAVIEVPADTHSVDLSVSAKSKASAVGHNKATVNHGSQSLDLITLG